MVSEGDTVEDFTLVGTQDGEIDEYTLSNHTADGAVLLGVYVFDFSPVCSSQMCQLRDIDWYEYKKDLDLFGICTDGPYSHIEFAAQEGIGYPLLCDTSAEVIGDLGVLYEERDGLAEVPQRSLFLVDEDRRVVYKWAAEDNWEDGDFGLNPVEEALRRL